MKHCGRNSFLLCLLLALLSAGPASLAQESGWQAAQEKDNQPLRWVRTGGPLGGLGYDVRMDPRDPDVMYVTDAWAGVFKSTDGGATWFSTNSGITTRVGPSGDGIPVFSLTIDPNNPDRIWIGTQFSRSVYRSDNAGATWASMNDGILETAPTIRGFTVEPGNSDVVYLAGEVSSWEWNGTPLPGLGLDMVKGIVYKTVDGGQHWERIWSGDNLARYIWIHPQNHDLIYVSTGIFDREAANSDPIALEPGGVGILRSRDGGATWEVLGVENGIRADELYFGSLYMHPRNPKILLGAAGNDPYLWALGRPIGAIYRTEDGGDSWQRVLALPNASVVEICEGDPNVAYAASLSSFYRSGDGGLTWELQAGVGLGQEGQTGESIWGPPGVVAGFPIDLQCDPRDARRVFANAYGGGNFLSEDGGRTWRVASSGYTGALMAQLAVAQDDPAHLYATARSGVFESTNGGATWQGLSYGAVRAMESLAIAVDPLNARHIIASVGDAGPQPKLSLDGGQTWQDAGIELWREGKLQGMTTRIRFSPSDPQRVLASVGDNGCVLSGECGDEPGSGIIISRDGGQTWEMICPDAGTHMPPPSDPDMPRSSLMGLAVDPLDQNKLYAGFARGGLAVSHDGGVTWEPSSAGMPPEASVKAIVVDPTNPDVVYAGAMDSGVFVSPDGGQTWRELNDGLLTRAVRDLALSADGRVLYMASEGGGAFRLGTPPKPQPAPTATPRPRPTLPPSPTLPVPTPTPKPTATSLSAAPTPTPPPATLEPEEKAPKGGICGGAFALPLALVGLVWLNRGQDQRNSLKRTLGLLTLLGLLLFALPSCGGKRNGVGTRIAGGPKTATEAQTPKVEPTAEPPTPSPASPEEPTWAECRQWLASSQELTVPFDCPASWSFFRDELFKLGGGVFPVGDDRYYLVLFPDDWETVTDREVIISLHGTGGCAEWMLNQWYQASSPAHSWALVALQYYDRETKQYDGDEVIYQNLQTILDNLHAHCPIAGSDFFYHGFSRGSAQSFPVAIRDRADRQAFSAFIADSGCAGLDYPTLRNAPDDALAGAHFWMWCGENDVSSVDPGRMTCDVMQEDMLPYVQNHGGVVDALIREEGAAHGMFSGCPQEDSKECSAHTAENLGPSLPLLFDYIESFP